MLETLSNKDFWEVTEQDFPQAAGKREKLKFSLGYAGLYEARLAGSQTGNLPGDWKKHTATLGTRVSERQCSGKNGR